MMSGSDDKLAFIVGHYKSGSTWLLNLLSLHPDIRGIGETSIFAYTSHNPDLREVTARLYATGFWGRGGVAALARNRLAGWSRPLRSYWRPTLASTDRPTTRMDLSLLDHIRLRQVLLASSTPEDYCRRFFAYLRRALRPRVYLLEKNNNIGLVPYIKSIFPSSKLIAIYRDGRDVVVSEKFFLKNEAGRGRPFVEGVRGWKRAMERHLEYEKKYGIFSLSYESLQSDGEVVVRDLLTFLELPSDPAIVKTMLEKSSFKFVTGRNSGVEDANSFYRKGAVRDWRNHFTDEEIKMFKEIAGDILTTLRYEDSMEWRL